METIDRASPSFRHTVGTYVHRKTAIQNEVTITDLLFISRKPSASFVIEGLFKKQMPTVTRRISRRGHGFIEDKVLSSNGEVMSHSQKNRYRWSQINWRKLERSVFKLQKRVYRASQQGDIANVHNLQRLLVRSKSAKLLATRQVSQKNKGKRTAGVDGVKSLNNKQRLEMAMHLNLNSKSKPIRRILIPKPDRLEMRPLGIPTLEDRAKQALAKIALEPQWEAKFEADSYGFRPGRSCQDAIQAIFLSIYKSNKFILDADIRGCFDNINHSALLGKLETFPKIRSAIKGWLKAGIMDGRVYFKPKAGTPQGGVISPLLANIALHGLGHDTANALTEELKQHLKIVHNRQDKVRALSTLRIIRYADDFLVIHENEDIVKKAKIFIETWLKKIGLELNTAKTKIVHTLNPYNGNKPGVDFLGFHIRQFFAKDRKLGYKTIIKPTIAGQRRHRKCIRKYIKRLAAATQEQVIKLLTPIIKGWANYYRSYVARKAFESADKYVFICLWKWARWRHPNKGLKWIKNQYFRKYRNSNWRFMTSSNEVLTVHSDIHIKRHVKVQGHRSPYDGDLKYWARRMSRKAVKRYA